MCRVLRMIVCEMLLNFGKEPGRVQYAFPKRRSAQKRITPAAYSGRGDFNKVCPEPFCKCFYRLQSALE